MDRWRAALAAVGVLAWLIAGGCATAPARVSPRPATLDERRLVGRLLAPLLQASAIWQGPEDGCAVALGILPVQAINVGVTPHQTCKFGLLVTEGALEALPPEELQAAFAHEIGHVELGHFAARLARRQAEREARRKIEERGTTGGAVASAIPVIGPLLAIGVIGTQSVAESVTEGTYRSYDRDEEAAADRFAVDLLNRLPGPPPRCLALVALIERLGKESAAPRLRGWLSTHPSPAVRLEAVKGACT